MVTLTPLDLPLEKLCLDPNNPRFIDENMMRRIPEGNVHEPAVQSRALERILHDRYEVAQLRESIENVGFLPVDRLVVVQLPDIDRYMVVEGNRRLAALMLVHDALINREIDLPAEVQHSIEVVPVVVIEDPDKRARDHFARVLQGVRHLSSIKQWGPYQQAQLVATMIRDHKRLAEIKGVLGLSTARINSLRRVYFALEEMGKDPDFGEHAGPELFSHFEEALKIPGVRTWLEWDDENNSCVNAEHRQMFYSWCVGVDEDGERLSRKIVDAKDLRKLVGLMEDPVQFRRFVEDPRLTLADAARGAVTAEPAFDWRGVLQANANTLSQIPALELRQITQGDIDLLERIKRQCDDLLQMIHTAGASEAQSQ